MRIDEARRQDPARRVDRAGGRAGCGADVGDFPSRTPTEPLVAGPPLPSTMRALVMRMSNGRGVCGAAAASVAAQTIAAKASRFSEFTRGL